MCLPGSAEEPCYETQPQTAGLLGDGPALPGNPEANKHTHALCLFNAMKALLHEYTAEFFVSAQENEKPLKQEFTV